MHKQKFYFKPNQIFHCSPPDAACVPLRHHDDAAGRRHQLQHLLGVQQLGQQQQQQPAAGQGVHPQRADRLHLLQPHLRLPRAARIHSHLLCFRNGATNV